METKLKLYAKQQKEHEQKKIYGIKPNPSKNTMSKIKIN